MKGGDNNNYIGKNTLMKLPARTFHFRKGVLEPNTSTKPMQALSMPTTIANPPLRAPTLGRAALAPTVIRKSRRAGRAMRKRNTRKNIKL